MELLDCWQGINSAIDRLEADAAQSRPPGSALSNRDRAIWQAAITLAHNMCIQDSDRINSEDGSLSAVNALSAEAKRIRGWLEPTNEQLLELFTEAGVPVP